TVIEFDENRRIAWQARPAGGSGRFVGGRIWRYELEPVAAGTRVRESWDLSQDRQRPMLKLVMAKRTQRSMEKTLERIEELTSSGSS
ncbi:MAG: SRPBCC family protein, partial [Acidimicrobiales bacterium]